MGTRIKAERTGASGKRAGGADGGAEDGKKTANHRGGGRGRPELDPWVAQGYNRAAIARMDHIRELVSAGRYPNAHGIARELEWGLRTVKRDLAFMRERLNLPMEFDQERNGYYFTKPVPYFPAFATDRAGGAGHRPEGVGVLAGKGQAFRGEVGPRVGAAITEV